MIIHAAADEAFVAHVRLACAEGVGDALRKRLLERFGSPQAVFAASPAALATVEAISRKALAGIRHAAADPAIERMMSL
ncbi:MAG: hypothetical protein EBR23_13290, partial [Planctomycetia bacterium]|nr:hypothetical protein [Planctomycetia bacterium]